ncbi:MAG: ABC transporter ATP-binding protein [Bifidobacteriaceae bacterium]|nr:ABC transporter ATP-binding protein [Bifidobacteriaceae bacterium]
MELLLQRAQSGSTVIVASHDADFIHHCDGIIDVEHYTADEQRFAQLRQAAKQADDYSMPSPHSRNPDK